MCGRVIIPGTKEILQKMPLRYEGDPLDLHLNGAPTNLLPVVTNTKPDLLQYFTWSVIPSYAKEFKPAYTTFNATIEGLEQSPLWKPLIGKRHCLFITKGFYEWNYDDPIKKKGSHPHIIRATNSNLTYMAGLWTVWVDPITKEMKPSCSMITLPANPMMAKIHNTKARMPAFLTNETAKIWLDNEISFEERKKAIEPVSDDFLQAVEIKKVGDAEEYLRMC